MSRGLGQLQRDILATITEAKESSVLYRGSTTNKSDPLPYCLPGWVVYRGVSFRLPESVYDLRASARHLANLRGAVRSGGYIREAFQAAFSRAVAGLVSRRLLLPVDRIHASAVERDRHGVADDGVIPIDHRRTVRFVVVA